MIRTLHVTKFNRLVSELGLNPMYIMTVGNGSMLDKERVKGWVAYSNPKLGDVRDFAKWFANQTEMYSWLRAQA